MEGNDSIDWNYPLRKQMRAWVSQFPNAPHQQRTAFIIGYAFSGKSTFCELCKKHVAKEPTGIKYEKPKYVLNEVISNCSTKICTLLPQVYRFEGISLVDVPAIILSPEIKLTKQIENDGIQSSIIVQYMLRMFKKSTFILVVSESNAKQRTDSWKKIIEQFLGFFKSVPDQFYDSIAFLITKASPNSKKSHFLKRIDLLRDEMKSSPNYASIQKLLAAIIKNEAIVLNYKGQEMDQKESEHVNQAFNDINSLSPFQMMNTNVQIKTIQNVADNQKNEVCQYWHTYQVLVQTLTNFLTRLIQRKVQSVPQFAEQKRLVKKRLGIASNKGQIEQSKQKLPQMLDIVMMFADLFQILTEDGVDTETKNFGQNSGDFLSRSVLIQQAVNKFYKNQLLDEKKDWQIGQIVRQLNQFYKMMHSSKSQLDVDLRTVKDAFNAFCQSQNTNKIIEIIFQLSQQQQKPRDYFNSLAFAIQVIQKQCEKSAEINFQRLAQAKTQIELKSNHSATPLDTIKALIKLYKNLQAKQKKQETCQAMYNLAKQFKKQGCFSEALLLFKKGQFPGRFITLIEQLLKQEQLQYQIVRNIFDSISYIAFDLGLFEKALSLAYQLDDKMVKSVQRKQLGQTIQNLHKMNKQRLNQSVIKMFKQKKAVYLSSEQMKIIEKAVQLIEQKKVQNQTQQPNQSIQRKQRQPLIYSQKYAQFRGDSNSLGNSQNISELNNSGFKIVESSDIPFGLDSRSQNKGGKKDKPRKIVPIKK